MATLLDSISESNFIDGMILHSDTYIGFGQTFTTPDDGKKYVLDTCKFYLAKHTNPVGQLCYAKVHTLATPDGYWADTLLATSDARDSSEFRYVGNGYALETFTFSGTNKIILDPNTMYVITCHFSGSGDNNNVYVGRASGGAQDGSYTFNDTNWAMFGDRSFCFYVYGNMPTGELKSILLGTHF